MNRIIFFYHSLCTAMRWGKIIACYFFFGHLKSINRWIFKMNIMVMIALKYLCLLHFNATRARKKILFSLNHCNVEFRSFMLDVARFCMLGYRLLLLYYYRADNQFACNFTMTLMWKRSFERRRWCAHGEQSK